MESLPSPPSIVKLETVKESQKTPIESAPDPPTIYNSDPEFTLTISSPNPPSTVKLMPLMYIESLPSPASIETELQF